MANAIQVTQEGFDKLKKELEELQGPVRMRVAEAIREAKSHGDLRENAAYHEAKLNQTRLESRINDLEKALMYAKIVERKDDGGVIAQLGSVVKVLDEEFGDEIAITLVGSFEADPSQDMVSIGSPLGEALLGKIVGDIVEVAAPAGTTRYKILHIKS
ncbi:MAG: transcription elongation factor GreA [Armatimonadetes bacterium Cent15-Ar3]|jgi:transcription elongation factor GreA|nr:MAG: transcription elongation factor GreA [Armatimonadetes bacterium Cent15-Ar3]